MGDSLEFKKWKKLVDGRAILMARKYKLDCDDVVSKSHEIFIKTVEKYDKEKSSFGTFLFHRLEHLRKYCGREKAKLLRYDSLNEKGDDIYVPSIMDFTSAIERVESKKELSETSRVILGYILSREWEKEDGRAKKANFSMICRHFIPLGIRLCELKKSWKELTEWWDRNYAIF